MAEKTSNNPETVTPTVEKEGLLSNISHNIRNVVQRVRTAVERIYNWSKNMAQEGLKKIYPEFSNELSNLKETIDNATRTKAPPEEAREEEEAAEPAPAAA